MNNNTGTLTLINSNNSLYDDIDEKVKLPASGSTISGEIELRWCYGCDETKPLTKENWAWANKEHTRFRTKCRKCTNFDSMISHRIHRNDKKQNN